jgi:hypothetical protein
MIVLFEILIVVIGKQLIGSLYVSNDRFINFKELWILYLHTVYFSFWLVFEKITAIKVLGT